MMAVAMAPTQHPISYYRAELEQNVRIVVKITMNRIGVTNDGDDGSQETRVRAVGKEAILEGLVLNNSSHDTIVVTCGSPRKKVDRGQPSIAMIISARFRDSPIKRYPKALRAMVAKSAGLYMLALSLLEVVAAALF